MATVVALGSGIAAWLTTGGGQARGAPLSDPSVYPPPALHATPSTEVAAPTTTTTTTTTNPGSLSQTEALPPTNSPPFQSDMAALWKGVVSDSPTIALPAFFPEQAYEQVKTITDAQGDYENRLVHDYSLDITAAHDLLGPDPSSAVLVDVEVPESDRHWVPPGVCDNRIGYFEVANSRVVYQQHGVTRSFGIASLISWRGVWYVVHLGAILRSSEIGVVEDPEVGTGYSAPSSTC
ncbi:MAG TPA: hypothetical protein VMU64_08700 [Acidimicrobiales bacterium]|nr:hypothetical protein [Acidimicrobiales bacterium]